MPAFCSNCGTKQTNAAKFCPNCGQPTASATPTKKKTKSPLAGPEKELWTGQSKSLISEMSSGKVAEGKYRMTTKMLYFEKGLITTKSEQVPLWAIRDVDVKRDLSQKMRKVGTVLVHVEHSDYTGRPNVEIKDIEDYENLKSLLNEHAQKARIAHEAWQKTHFYGEGQ